MTDWLPRWPAIRLDHRPGARDRHRRVHRRRPGLHHRLHRGARPSSSPSAGCCRLPRRVWVLPGRHAVSALDPTFELIGGGPGLDRRDRDLDRGSSWLHRHRGHPVVRPAAATAVRFPAPADVGRGAARRRGLRHRARSGRLRQRLPLAGRPRHPVREGARHHRAGGRSQDRGGHPLAAGHRHRRDDRHDLPGHASPVRSQRLRLRRQPRRRRAGRHQHPLDDHEDVHPDGHPVRHQRGDRLGPSQRRHARPRARATSCT